MFDTQTIGDADIVILDPTQARLFRTCTSIRKYESCWPLGPDSLFCCCQLLITSTRTWRWWIFIVVKWLEELWFLTAEPALQTSARCVWETLAGVMEWVGGSPRVWWWL